MSAVYSPKTLAKTLAYILYHSPGEHGLFWDPDGTMPWKEFYWVLQEDPSLRFVRESHLKEIAGLGIDFPAIADGRSCRLKEGHAQPHYPVAEHPPRRLYCGCPKRRLPIVRDDGLRPTSRPFLPLLSDRDMALRMARRRDPEGVVIEVQTEKAVQEGITFLAAGGPLYLSLGIPSSCLLLPLIREEGISRAPDNSKRKKTATKPTGHATPGSFLMTPGHLQDALPGLPGHAAAGKPSKKGARGPGWKRDSRKERNKRDI
jgi:putative RNA 2'-phosphotransferase